LPHLSARLIFAGSGIITSIWTYSHKFINSATQIKIQIFSALLVATVLLCGCSTTKFTAYRGSEVFQGKGDAVRSVDGIDLWYNEDPDRKYKVLGFIEETSRHRHLLGRSSGLFSDSEDRDSAIAKDAHKRGADAVILVGGDLEPSSAGDDADRSHQRIKKLVIVKYVE
jgi:hypothetical protein